MFSIDWRGRTHSKTRGDFGLSYSVQRMSWSALWGCKLATAVAFGDIESLYQMTQRLRYGVVIGDNKGNDAWWGFLDGVTIHHEGSTYTVNLANMWNSIQVEYTSDTGATTTGANTHALSVSTYGKKEIVVSASDIDTAEAAEAMRDRLVEFYGLPRVEQNYRTGNTATFAELMFVGWANTLGWRYYSNTGTSDVATTTQISDIVSSIGEFYQGTNINDASGINTIETRDGSQRASGEIEKLLNVGVSGGNRLLTKTTPGRRIEVSAEPNESGNYYQYKNGRLCNFRGYEVQPYIHKVGFWVVDTTNFLAKNTSILLSDTGKFFVEEAEYDVATNRWTPTPRGSYIPGGVNL